MLSLNQLYLSELLNKYELKSIEMFQSGFSSYYVVSSNKKMGVNLILCNDYTSFFDIDTILDKISLLEKKQKIGNIYLCIIPKENPTSVLCTHCNGKSFVHFIFFDNCTNGLVYDKNIYYLGSKLVKKLIDIFQNCFDNLN